MSKIAAVPVMNRKGQLSMQPTKVDRYRRGKVPKGVQFNSDDDDDDEVEEENDTLEKVEDELNEQNRFTLESFSEHSTEFIGKKELHEHTEEDNEEEEETELLLSLESASSFSLASLSSSSSSSISTTPVRTLKEAKSKLSKYNQSIEAKEDLEDIVEETEFTSGHPKKSVRFQPTLSTPSSSATLQMTSISSYIKTPLPQSNNSTLSFIPKSHSSTLPSSVRYALPLSKPILPSLKIAATSSIDPFHKSKNEVEEEHKEEEEDSEEEEEEEEETPSLPKLKPFFVPKHQRSSVSNPNSTLPAPTPTTTTTTTISSSSSSSSLTTKNTPTPPFSSTLVYTTERDATRQRERVEESKKLLQQEIQRDFQSHQLHLSSSILLAMEDDQDTLQSDHQFQLWQQRELQRLIREYEQRSAKEKERKLIEQRRQRSDQEKQREAKEVQLERQQSVLERPKMNFLQKYYHKGAFYLDDASQLMQRNYAEATLEDHFHKDKLPEILQKRNVGKSGQSKWTHLVKEDTLSKDAGWYKDKTVIQSLEKKRGGMGEIDRPSKHRRR